MTAVRARALPNVLSVAGSDPSGGAGIQADLKTFAAFGVYGCAAPVALTAQSTRGVADVLPVPAAFVARQLDALLDDVTVDAAKVGMLGSADVARVVAAALGAHGVPNVVVDPVLRASTGRALLDADALDVLRAELLPLATIVTPNAAEAGALLRTPAPGSVAEMRDAAAALRALGPMWALVTGGHVDAGDECVDVLAGPHETHALRVRRVPDGDRHGTGCTLSSAVAALLGLGADVPTACAEAQRYVARAIAAADALDVGRGRGPLRHVPFVPATLRSAVTA